MKNPVLNDDQVNKIEAQLRSAAQAEDDIAFNTKTTEAAEPAKVETRVPTDKKSDDQKPDQAEKSDETKTSDEKQVLPKESSLENEKGDPEKKDVKESKYQKAKKDAERLDRSWSKLNSEKDTFRAEREKFEAERNAFEAEKKQKKIPDELAEFSPDELEEAAVEFEKDGKLELATKALSVSRMMRENENAQLEHQQEIEFTKKRNDIWRDLTKEHPDLMDASSQLSENMKKMFAEYPVLTGYPEGPKDALKIIKLREAAASADSLGKRVAELEAENKKLKEATSLNDSPLNERTLAKDFSEMSTDEQESWLKSEAMRVDREMAVA